MVPIYSLLLLTWNFEFVVAWSLNPGIRTWRQSSLTVTRMAKETIPTGSCEQNRVQKAQSLQKKLERGLSRIHRDVGVVAVGAGDGDECGIEFSQPLYHRRWRGQQQQKQQSRNEGETGTTTTTTTATRPGPSSFKNSNDIIFVHRNEFLTPELGLNTPLGQALQLYLSNPITATRKLHVNPEKLPHIYLAIYLALYQLGRRSPTTSNSLFFFPENESVQSDYLRTLPSPTALHHLPVFWKEDMLNELQCSVVKQGVTTRRNEWNQEFLLVQEAIQYATTTTTSRLAAPATEGLGSPSIEFMPIHLTREDWFWARSIITTRAFTDSVGNNEPCLCPFVDMMNHVTEHQAEVDMEVLRCHWEIDSDGYHLQLPEFDMDKVRHNDDQNHLQQQQQQRARLEISHGTQSSASFLMNYGFSIWDDDDPTCEDVATLPVKLPDSVHTKETETLWEADGMGDCHALSREVTVGIGNVGPMESVLSLCRVASTQAKELATMKQEFHLRKEETSQTQSGLVPAMAATLCRSPFSMSNEKLALEMLQRAICTALDQYSTTFGQDTELLKDMATQSSSSPSSPPPPALDKEDWDLERLAYRNAITVRRGEKRILLHYYILATIGLKFLESSPPTTAGFETYKGMLEASLEDPNPFFGF